MIEARSENISNIILREELSAGQRDEMFGLLARHFEGVTRSQFERDLAEKSRVILLRRGERLVGFSTLLAYETSCGGRSVNVIYSGDTIVTPEAWGTTALARAWIACVRDLRESFPAGKCYWLLLTSGFRTYRFLPVFWREFYPRFDATTPAHAKGVIDGLAAARFGSQYDPAEGIVRFHSPQKLRGELGAVASGRTTDPHITFFLARNPGHARGDELACLTELSDENLTAAGRRMVGLHSYESLCRHG